MRVMIENFKGKPVGINISYSTQQWDATSNTETMKLMHQFFATQADEHFVFFSNFSGATGTNNNFNDSFRTVVLSMIY
jgi:hypothetical protein